MTLETEAKKTPARPEVDISIQEPAWEELHDIEDIVRVAAEITLTSAIMPKAAFGRDLEVSIVLANDDLIHVLNREYREQDKPTNVLTFATLDSEEPAIEGVLNLGDVLMSYQTVQRECVEQGKFPIDHIRHLTVHGILHLLGYDHQTDDQATDMETLEIRILERLGVQNPYVDMDFVL